MIPAAWKHIGANTLWLIIARLGSQAFMILFTILIARRLGGSGLGAYAFMAAVIFFGNVLTTFGTDMLIFREVAARRDLTLLLPALILQLALSTLFVLLVYLVTPALSFQDWEAIRALRVYSLALFPMAFYTVFSAALRGVERMDAFMWLNLVIAALQTGLVWVFIKADSSLTDLSWLLFATQIVVALLAGLFCLFWISGFLGSWHSSWTTLSTMLRASTPIAVLSIVKVLYQRGGIYLLTVLLSLTATGWFSAASRVVEAAQTGHIALMGALFPVMAQTYLGSDKSNPGSSKTLLISWRLILLLGGGLAAILFFLAPLLTRLLYGPGFEPAILALRLLAWVLIPYSVNLYLSSQLLSARQELKITFAFTVSLIILVALNVWWIPRLGLVGACLAALTAETIQAAVFIWLGRGSFEVLRETR
jgi:O-antigen/teichoic acid export membrane protein